MIQILQRTKDQGLSELLNNANNVGLHTTDNTFPPASSRAEVIA